MVWILFDLDSTLVLPSEKPVYHGHMAQNPQYVSLREQMVQKAVEYGVPAEEFEEDNRMALIYNRTREATERLGVSDEIRESVMKDLDSLIRAMERQEHREAKLMPKAKEVLQALRESGHKIGIVTNTSEEELLEVLERFSLKDYIDAHVTRNQVKYIKPHPEPVEKILSSSKATSYWYVGDADHDILASRAASKNLGLASVSVLINTRGYDRETIETMNPDHTIDSLEELIPLLGKKA